ncbi:hypothetical protein [Cognataquiflexum rubidum]|uniref:hypothetical protein n=1 Tax=Cognataquiflexum rubidum TaxID=2922273 RepID=UPI001F137BF9|nr:hypothetical protein [Cognataquiflexum rubidum]MCH6236080.1 hypothetical protein [Cognataquiflexum rubidum]
MKTILYSTLIVLCLTLSHSNLMAQEEGEAKTLFGNNTRINTKDLGFFVAPSFGFTQMDGGSASLFNLRGGVNLKDNIAFGAYFNTSVNDIRPQSETVPNVYMDYWSVGGFAEYTLLSKNLLHVSFPLYIGYGEVEMDNENGNVGLGEANFFQLEPSALLAVNLHKYVRLNVGAGYRFVGQMEYRNFNQSDISGLTGYIGLKFGLFR